MSLFDILFGRKTKAPLDPLAQLRKDVRGWNMRQLDMRSADLEGRLDGLLARRRDLIPQRERLLGDIAAQESLQRMVDVGSEDDRTLEHLRGRERQLQGQIDAVEEGIAQIDRQLEVIYHERDGRE